MLTVLLIWLYVIVTTYLVGYGFLTSMTGWPGMHREKGVKGSRGVKKYDFRFRESYIIAGIVLVTVYAQIISLFSGVGLGANLGLVCVCILIGVYYREELYGDLREALHQLISTGSIFIYLGIFLLLAYGTGHGLMHYDSDLYHAQAIHWIEEYGIVKGLGNLHVRFAYNSASFAMSALYSFRFLGGQSYHVMSGFFALLLGWQCADIKNVYRRGHLVISDFARFAAIYYLFTIFDEIVAPASDYFLSTLVFYIIICWLDMFVKHEKNYVPYILLALLGVYAITIKLSAAPLLLLTVVPLYRLLCNRTKEKLQALWISIALALAIALPYLIRNVVLSGWLVYPVTFINIFNVDFKIPKGLAAYDALEIKTFGRGYNDVAAYGNVSFSEWVPHWFNSITGLNKIMLILDIVAIVAFLIYFGYFIFDCWRVKSEKLKSTDRTKVFELSRRSMLRTADFMIIGATVIGCFVFWFFSAPLIRYGVVYVWLVPVVILGRLFILCFNRMGDKTKEILIRVFTGLFLIWMLYKIVFLVVDERSRFNPEYFVKQQDYGVYETKEFYLGGEKIYYPAEGDQIGYYPFPSATHDLTGEVELIGSTVKEGFRHISE